MLEIDDKVIALDVLKTHFVCDISACKGACCVEGDAGAPLLDPEISILEDIFDEVKPYLTAEGKQKIEENGVFYIDQDGDAVTTLMEDGTCAFASVEKDGTVLCGIEKAYRDKKVNFEKPLSCALFPVRLKKYEKFTAVNYEELKICKPACDCGANLKIPLYKFLKKPLIRAFGKDFYEKLEVADEEINANQDD